MVMRVLALTMTVEPSLPLSQRMRATSRQRPGPMFLFRGIQRKLKRPFARMCRWAIGAEFCALRTETRMVREHGPAAAPDGLDVGPGDGLRRRGDGLGGVGRRREPGENDSGEGGHSAHAPDSASRRPVPHLEAIDVVILGAYSRSPTASRAPAGGA
jgi:hypothetical protein